jgi:hypothetical protein
MKTLVKRRLLTVSRDIAETRAELAMARDELATAGGRLDEFRLRMLIAETPLADRDLRFAVEGFRRVEERVRRLEADLEVLRAERRRLAHTLA